jgi:ABC-2 type transport system permease protein
MLLALLNSLSNKLAATSISREGSNWIYMKYIPVPIADQVLAKILPSFVVNVIIALAIIGGGGYVLVTRTGVDALVVASGCLLMVGGFWLMTCVSAWNESRNPNVEWGNDGDVNPKTLKGTGSEMRSMLVGFVYAALPLLVSPLVRLDPHVFMPILAIVGVVTAVVLGRALLAMTVRNIRVFE